LDLQIDTPSIQGWQIASQRTPVHVLHDDLELVLQHTGTSITQRQGTFSND